MAEPESKPKVMIGIPGFAGVVPEAQEALARMIFRCGRDLPQYDFALEIVTKREQFRARNQLVDSAIASGCAYLLMLDDDMIIPPDLVSLLLAAQKDVVGALYWQRGGAFHPVLMRTVEQPTGEMTARFLDPFDPVITKPGLHQVDVIGGGCMLFNVDIFRKLTQPYFWWEDQLGTDIAICVRLASAGVSIWVDTRIELGHLCGERTIITRQSIPLGTQAAGAVRERLFEDAQAYLGMPPGELESAMVQASHPTQRQQRWGARERETWDGIKDFYTSFGDWQILNLMFFAMSKRDQIFEWLINQGALFFGEKATIIDLGPGLGLTTLALAERGHAVFAVDLAGAPTLDFVHWRVKRRHLRSLVTPMPFQQPVPEIQLGSCDAALLLSMLEHCADPYGTLEWAIAQLKPGGWLICDYPAEVQEKEPQHLVRYDPTTLPRWLYEHGMRQELAHTWLWQKGEAPHDAGA